MKIDDTIPTLGFWPALVLVAIFGIALELSGNWITMLVAGALGALFLRDFKRSFFAGFLGVGLGWSILFGYYLLVANALTIADFFVSLLGLSGMGWLVIVISVIIGAFLGGFGGTLGRAIIELLDELFVRTETQTNISVNEGSPSNS